MTGPVCKNLRNSTCFAIDEGKCSVLDNTVFKNNICPFRKTREQIEIENEKGQIRRANLEEYDNNTKSNRNTSCV